MGCVVPKHVSEFRDEYILGKKLAEGTFGAVHLCVNKKTRNVFAVKLIEQKHYSTANTSHEVKLMKIFKHPNVVLLTDDFRDKNFEYIVMEKFDTGYIDVVQAHLANGQIGDAHLVPLFQQMCRAVQHLHHKKVVHRDVKADNFLMDRFDLFDVDCRVVLCDMGTVIENYDNQHFSEAVGTRLYWAPEIHQPKLYSFPVDVWALGVTLYGSVCGRFPFATPQQILKKVLGFGSNKYLSKHCIEFLTALLTKDVEKRPDIDQVLELSWLQVSITSGTDEKLLNPKGNMELEDITTKKDPIDPETIKARQQAIRDAGIDVGEDSEKDDVMPFSTQNDGVTRLWEWWAPGRLGRQLGPSHQYHNKREDENKNAMNELSLAWTPLVIQSLFERYGIDLSKFGIGQANTIENIAKEVIRGECAFLEADGKTLFRQVVVVVVKVSTNTPESGLCYLVETKLQFEDGRERVTDRLPGTKIRPHESVQNAAHRCLVEYLGLEPAHIEILPGDERSEEKRESPAYPGLTTLYVKRFVSVQLQTKNPQIRQQLHMDSLEEFKLKSSMGDVRSWDWWPEAKCGARQMVLHGQVGTDFHFLRASPLDTTAKWTVESLTQTLSDHKVDISSYGQGTAYTFEQFIKELNSGAAALMEANGQLVRVLDVVLVRINTMSEKVLIEAKSTLSDGRVLVRNRLPGTKRQPNENVWKAALRLVDSMPDIRDQTTLQIGEEETEVVVQESGSYPGVQSVYRKTYVSGTLLPKDASQETPDYSPTAVVNMLL
eukprot:GEMP01003825.1.p1 GENE.GEMP01003825.1~~GEMP01003825.1.p1  ORF type:complete len:771 (+),score=139.66 GEMP01003825.1:2-2314(+)